MGTLPTPTRIFKPRIKQSSLLKHLKTCAWLIICVLAGCSHSTPWQHQEMVSCLPAFKSSKLTLAPPNLYTGIGVELLKGHEATRGFFNVFVGQMSSDEGIVWINDQPIYFKGTLMEGKQRLLLPPAITKEIVNALLEGQNVSASIRGYAASLSAETFQTQYQKFSVN